MITFFICSKFALTLWNIFSKKMHVQVLFRKVEKTIDYSLLRNNFYYFSRTSVIIDLTLIIYYTQKMYSSEKKVD